MSQFCRTKCVRVKLPTLGTQSTLSLTWICRRLVVLGQHGFPLCLFKTAGPGSCTIQAGMALQRSETAEQDTKSARRPSTDTFPIELLILILIICYFFFFFFIFVALPIIVLDVHPICGCDLNED